MNNAFTDYLEQMQTRDAAPEDVPKVAPAPVSPAPAIGGDANDYLDNLRQRQDVEDGALNAFARAHKANPDEWAKMLQKGEAAGLSREVMEQFPAEAERRARYDEAAKLSRDAPKTAQWLARPDNAELAKDDTGPLADMERILAETIARVAAGGPIRKPYEFETQTKGALQAGMDRMGKGSAGLGAAAGESMSEYVTGPLARNRILPEDIGARIGAFYREQAKGWEAKAKQDRGDWSKLPWLGKAALQGVESMPGSAGAAIVGVMTRNPGLSAMFMAAPVGGDGYVDAREKGKGVAQSITHGSSQAVIEYATEFIPAAKMLQDLGLQQTFLTTLRNNLAREIPGEQAATALQDLNDWATLNPDKPFADYIKARPGAAAETLVATIVATGGQIAVSRVADDTLRGNRGQADQAFMQSIGDAATASKLRERMPSKYLELVDEIAKGGPVENIRIPAETFATYFQTAGLDPAAVAQEVGARNFDAAFAAHTDIIIPVGDYAAKIAATEHHAALMPDIRLRDGDLTAREYEAYKADRAEMDARMAVEASQEAGGDNLLNMEIVDSAMWMDAETAATSLMSIPKNERDAYIAEIAKQDALHAEEISALLTTTKPKQDGSSEVVGVSGMRIVHGSGNPNLTVEDIQIVRQGQKQGKKGRSFGGLYGSAEEDISHAEGYAAMMGGTPTVYDLLIRPGTNVLHKEGDITRLSENYINDLVAQGYGVVTGKDMRGRSEYVVIDRNVIESMQQRKDRTAEKKDALSIIEAHFRDQLLALGRSPAVADAYATAQARPIMRLAEEAGVDPMAIIEKYGLTVTSPLPDVLTKKGTTEASIDALLERLRTGDIPQDEAIYGQRLTDFLRKAGGIQDTQGELKGRDLDKNLKPGQSRLVRDDGLEFDAALTAARQAGYLPEAPADRPDETGINDLLDALLQDEQAGVFSSKSTNDELLQLRGMLESLGGYLDSLGIDLTQIADNAQVRELMKQAGEAVGEMADGYTLAQSMDGGISFTDDKRGYITIAPDRKLSIALLEKANLSTFLHEVGHAWLEIMGDLAESAGASEQLKADWAKVLKFLKVATRAEIGVEQHEMWARANEAYLMEGNAPSAELRGVFQKFKSWLKLIYKQIEALNVKLTPEVRGVFDRLYASEAEIEAAKQESETRPLFLDAAAAGMTEAEFALYTKAIADGTETAKENLESRLMREQQRETQKWWKDARDAVKAEVTAEVEATPVYRAFAALSAGQMPDGTPIRLSRDDLVKRYGEAWLKKLPRGFGYLYAKEGGADVQTAAEMLGFSDADALVNALSDMRPKKELIEAETDARMRDTYGDTLNDAEAMRQAAVSALHNDRQAEVLALELRALRKKRLEVSPFVQQERARAKDEKQAARAVVDAIPPLSAFRDAAAGMISQMQARDIRPGDYLRASQKANRDAFKAMAKDDHQAAYEAKRRELLNHYLYREALAAREEMDKLLDYARGFEKPAKRQRIGKAGADYLEQIDGILENYEFKRVTLRTMNRRTSLNTWAEQMEAEGHAVNVSPELLDDAKIVNYREASMDTLRAVRDALVNIEHLAGLKNKLLKKKGAIEWEAVETELLGALAANTKSIGALGEINRFGESISAKGARLWRRFDAAHLKVEQIVEWLDGGKIDGPWARYFFDLADDAQTREYDLHKEITKRLQDLSESMPKEWRDGLIERVPGFSLPGISASQTTRATLISIALNAGNTSNLDKMLRGHNWTPEQLDLALKQMSEADWSFVQGVWDTLETLWPEIAALEKRVSGVEPTRVDAREIETTWGVMRGGYYPMVYDQKRSSAGEKQADATESVQDFMARGYGRASTSKGHTKARLDEFAAPLRLDYEQVLSSQLSKVIKDISHREAVIGLTKILKSRAIKPELIDRLGEEKYTLLNEWVQTLISDRADTLHQSLSLHNSLFRGLRTNTAIVTMGWKISTMMSQFAGFGPSVDLVGYRNLSAATVEFTTHPKDTLAMVFEKSGEMRHRTNTIERDMKEQLLKLRGNPGLMAATQRTAFYLTAMADRMVSVPTWLAGYRKALAENMSEDDAIRAGDRAVRLSQGAGGAKDLAAVQRQSELMKLLTMYYTPFSVLYARLRDVGQTTNSVRDLPRLVARSIALVILPAVLGELLAGRGPDDDEDEVWWAARKAVLYPSASVPILRDLVQWQLEPALVELTGGSMHYQPRYQFSPILSAVQKIASIPDKTLDAMTGDREWDEVAWDVFEASGYVFGLPTAQPRITGEYLTDLMGGDANPESIGEALHDLAFRRPRQ